MSTNDKRPARRVSTPETRLRSRARKLSNKALDTLAKIMDGEGQDSVRLAAAREVLDRGFGRSRPGDTESPAEGTLVLVRRFSDQGADEGEVDEGVVDKPGRGH